jgi:hypothetical protein
MMDNAAASLFLAGLAAREARNVSGLVLWASCRTDLYAPGLAQAGLLVADVIHAQPRDDQELLAVVEDAVRDGTPSAVTPVRHLTNVCDVRSTDLNLHKGFSCSQRLRGRGQ